MKNTPKDLREHSRQTKKRLAVSGVILTVLLGTLLIAFLYGTPAAGCGLVFFFTLLIPVALIIFILSLLQWIVKDSDGHDS
ncbi:MAG: hypothetical protein ACK2UB_00010 [Anaerolineales bacterium]